MDRIDVGILRWYLQGHLTAPFRAEVRPNVRLLSERMGVTGETVRNRMRRMFASGVLTGVVAQPNPGVLGMKAGALGLYLQHGAARAKVARSLALVEGMQVVATHIDGMVGVVFLHEGGTSLERKVNLMKEIAGATESEFTDVPFPQCDVVLGKPDWGILAALRPDASQSYGVLGKKTGLSPRTVKRRLDRLVAGRAVFTLALHNVRAVHGSLEANVVVRYEAGATRPAVDEAIVKALDDSLVYAGVWSSYSAYAVSIPNLAAADAIGERVAKIRGVKYAKASVMEERLEVYDSVDRAIAEKLGEATPKLRQPAAVAKGRTKR